MDSIREDIFDKLKIEVELALKTGNPSTFIPRIDMALILIAMELHKLNDQLEAGFIIDNTIAGDNNEEV